jgi:hypothetical protein
MANSTTNLTADNNTDLTADNNTDLTADDKTERGIRTHPLHRRSSANVDLVSIRYHLDSQRGTRLIRHPTSLVSLPRIPRPSAPFEPSQTLVTDHPLFPVTGRLAPVHTPER